MHLIPLGASIPLVFPLLQGGTRFTAYSTSISLASESFIPLCIDFDEFSYGIYIFKEKGIGALYELCALSTTTHFALLTTHFSHVNE